MVRFWPPIRSKEPVDPDVDLHVPAQRRELRFPQSPVVAVVAVGGAMGACARYGAGLLWPDAPDAFPWTTMTVNAVGCGVIGVFMVIISDVWAAHRLVRPFFGTGVLGGFTTFSTYANDIRRLVEHREARTGLVYMVLTVLVALAAVWIGSALTRRVVEWRQQ
ncbi:CrcB protein [Actinacidiphila yanglinensis]|uniref:Fluoride-specific ion channel FluC n=1 Tax=Actinacidiphila yanglinensis TaxID=310779 RepID=A0A1H6DP82_9ACTN|nr:CrcB protein [Actinacidiphila yanglinensis]